MRAPRLDRVTASAVLALSLALASPAATQQATDNPPSSVADLQGSGAAGAIESRIPLPDLTELPPLTAADVGVGAAEPPAADAPKPATSVASAPVTPPAPPAMTDEQISRGVPLPESAGLSPITIKDIGTPPVAVADQPIADRLKELVTGRLDRFIDRGKKERTAVEEFYKARGYAPVFVEQGAPSARMKAAIARLKAADSDGLDANDYATPDLKVLGGEAEALAQAELKLVNSVLNYARHAQVGRVTISRISTNIEWNPVAPEPADVLKKVAEAKDAGAALDDFNPPHEGYKALKRKLAEQRGRADDSVTQIPAGQTLKRGMNDKRVPLLRERLNVDGDPSDTKYDGVIVDAVKAFQRSKGMKDNGVLAQSTLEALNGRSSRSRDINTIVSNMERWRWIPRDLGQAYVMVNIPDFSLKVVRANKQIWNTRIVVGKPATPSPSFSAAIENILVNPTWHVPQSIIYGEYLPALQQDPSVLARMGLIMERERDGTISIRQPPGPKNALGRIKFNFPNRFQVYLHDTPDKNLFAHDRRAYSHGCMRVQNPDKFGEVLLSIAMPQERYTAERLTGMFGGSEQWLKFKKTIPVYLVYMNAYVNEEDKLVVREDLYGYDGRVQSALRGEYTAIAERSQRVTPGVPVAGGGQGGRRTREAYQQPQQRGWSFFPFFPSNF